MVNILEFFPTTIKAILLKIGKSFSILSLTGATIKINLNYKSIHQLLFLGL
jgi:hypothetical protein